MPTGNCALIDSHCHPHFPPLGDDLNATLATMREHQVDAALAVATERAEWTPVKTLAAAHPGVLYAACGVHPTTDETATADNLIAVCDAPEVLAVGETGLDFYRSAIPPEVQRQRFDAHIAAAAALQKPLIIHTRDSMEAAIEQLRTTTADLCGGGGGVFHCFTGDINLARKVLDLNFYVSFSGIVSFKNADTVRAAAAFVPADRYLVETDAPYLAPAPYRGKVNTPGYVRYVAQALAAARQCPEEQIAAETRDNFNALFRPPPL